MLVRELVQRTRRREGFSLVELMVVVAIIAILAAIAVPQYKKYQLKAKTSEARMNIGAIRTAEEAYAAEEEKYVGCAADPTNIPGPTAQSFSYSGGFKTIGFKPSGNVYYSYAVYGAENGTSFSTSTNATATEYINIVVVAEGDLDGNGAYGSGNSISVTINGNTNGTDITSVTVTPNHANNGLFWATDENSKIHDANPGVY